ncbi:AAA family ATPase [Tellurirhabdus bombi]|uniref:AAA family ATPase n=1 Tax=Tellurirhabdus bombi TaxID=2907205 RepID=UPI001F3F7E64|nr:ATP-binding protein [Tellurirhabdus bombi]
MIKPEEFPYIKSLHVNDCYAYKDFDIVLHNYQPFSHLILTGKNGSGKSTILKAINSHILIWRGSVHQNFLVQVNDPSKHIDRLKSAINQSTLVKGEKAQDVVRLQQDLEQLDRLSLYYNVEPINFWILNKNVLVYSFLLAKRESKVTQVTTVSKETDFVNQLLKDDSTQKFTNQFKQYLVNQKVYQAFDQLNNNKEKIEQTERFFSKITETFRSIFEDKGLELVFVQESFDFYIQLSDGRQLTFDTLSEGFSALLSILMDLFMRVDLIRKQVGNFSYNPCGIVLIDEPETHLHLELQYQVLPLLTSLFPNIQFIAATHSPAIISSIKKATIFDLTTKETVTDEVVGKSFSELMVTHFGLENEYSPIADRIIEKVNHAMTEASKEKRRELLQTILVENERYLSPTLKIELESIILQNA